jgi:hypothetical protein
VTAEWISAIANIGLLIAAIYSIVWIRRQYHQRQAHEDERRVPHVGFRLEPANYGNDDDEVPVYDPNPEFDRIKRWYALWEKESFGRYVKPMRGFTCTMTVLGPGVVSSAEVPYTVRIYNEDPVSSAKVADTFTGVFKFGYGGPGTVIRSPDIVLTGAYPWFQIECASPVIRDVTAAESKVTQDPHISEMSTTRNNRAVWEFTEYADALRDRFPEPRLRPPSEDDR